jgi:subtilase family serine protease
MSWGGSEFSTESAYDQYFTSTVNPGIVFFASIGDNGAGVIWPGSSPNVVSVGGTTLSLDSQTGAVETAWSGSGGGVSAYESQPAYQKNYGLTYTGRATPDVSYDANPSTGVYVYDSTPYNGAKGWYDVGGTSVGAPQWAAIQALGQTTGNNNFYQDAYQSASYFRDITIGSNGNPTATGYDLATGLGAQLPLTLHL